MGTLRAVTIGFVLACAGAAIADGESFQGRAQRGELEPRPLPGGTKMTPALSSTVRQALEQGSPERRAAQLTAGPSSSSSNAEFLGLSRGTLGCGARNTDGNVRVNQDCGFRPQNETIIKYNPFDPDNLTGGFNDYRTGEGHAGFSFSLDGGRTWGDGILPVTNRRNNPPPGHTIRGGPGTNHTYEAHGDPGLAWDSRGNAFYSAGVFDRSTGASAIFATVSLGLKGATYISVPNGTVNPPYVVAEDNDVLVLHDKPFIAADFYPGSRFRDYVYVTWSGFDFACGPGGNPAYCKSPIYFSRSQDHGRTWTTPKIISGSSPLCFFGDFFDPTAKPSDCNFDQGSDPVVLPNGDLVVVFNNGNTPPGNPNGQQLAVVSQNAGDTWFGPFKVGDDVTTGEPQCAGVGQCIPGAYVRTNDFPRIAVHKSNGHLYVVWQDYRTGEYDIQISRSIDGGFTWTEAAAPVNPDFCRQGNVGCSGKKDKDHYFPAVDVVSGIRGVDRDDRAGDDEESRSGDLVAVSYFRTYRIPGENTLPVIALDSPGAGQMNTDYSLAGGHGVDTPYAARRVSPETPPPSFVGFNGDYSGLVVIGRQAHPLWSDARNPAPAGQFGATPTQDEDIFTDSVPVLTGRAEQER